jgi:mRNA interferase RelE/StbE
MPYQISIQRRAIKALETIPEPYYTNIRTAIYDLADNPRPHGYRKLKNRDGYRVRVGDYRIIYEIIDRTLVVDVINLGHRREIYD